MAAKPETVMKRPDMGATLAKLALLGLNNNG